MKFRIEGRTPSSGGEVVRVGVFSGVDLDHLQNAGFIVLRVPEYEALEAALHGSTFLFDPLPPEVKS